MKVAILGNINSIHIQRWAEGLKSRGLEVHVITSHVSNLYSVFDFEIHTLPFPPPIGYFLNLFALNKIIKTLKPDILNAHYATGYGTLASMCHHKKLIISVWGADVYDFPKKSFVHHWLVKKNLLSSSGVASTSRCMRSVIQSITRDNRKVYITPFGVDIDFFCAKDHSRPNNNVLTIGTVKSLHNKYGIDTLIKAFHLLKTSLCDLSLKLVIVGTGPEEKKLRQLAFDLGIDKDVQFLGYIANKDLPAVLKEFDIFSALSRLDSESFGVSVIEAGACELPAVVSDVSGFCEVIVRNQTGYIVKRNNALEAAEAMLSLIEDSSLRERMGRSAREHVVSNYSWEISLDAMISAYEGVLYG